MPLTSPKHTKIANAHCQLARLTGSPHRQPVELPAHPPYCEHTFSTAVHFLADVESAHATHLLGPPITLSRDRPCELSKDSKQWQTWDTTSCARVPPRCCSANQRSADHHNCQREKWVKLRTNGMGSQVVTRLSRICPTPCSSLQATGCAGASFRPHVHD